MPLLFNTLNNKVLQFTFKFFCMVILRFLRDGDLSIYLEVIFNSYRDGVLGWYIYGIRKQSGITLCVNKVIQLPLVCIELVWYGC